MHAVLLTSRSEDPEIYVFNDLEEAIDFRDWIDHFDSEIVEVLDPPANWREQAAEEAED